MVLLSDGVFREVPQLQIKKGSLGPTPPDFSCNVVPQPVYFFFVLLAKSRLNSAAFISCNGEQSSGNRSNSFPVSQSNPRQEQPLSALIQRPAKTLNS